MKIAALIVAAGQGVRAGLPIPKQYAPLRGVPVLAQTLSALGAGGRFDTVQVVIGPGQHALYRAALPASPVQGLLPPVEGGATRQASVRHGLRALAASGPDRVLIHDAVRPFVTPDIVARVLAALDTHAGAIAALPLADSVKRAAADGSIGESVERAGLWRAQTPQAFRFADILAAHEAAAAAGREDFTDDAAVAEWHGLSVALVIGSERNRKITTAEDLAMADAALAADIRTGTGYDVHRLVPGTSVWLCGVEIPHTHKLEGHSDADVGLHALTDALLGAIGEADIGTLFPNTDPRWKGAASHIFLSEALRRVRAAGGTITNADVTLLCEAPKIAPHREAMRARIAGILEIEIGRVAVKATTTEGLGFTGRREGIAALATATVAIR
ncbi:MAG TPA: bifunctional 2-C-methyl-D-erythritol 4-phosphate cytidylyltransferase/2-C-methyl-D-erythritol 2,4-cyclodiphosphate synthase [Hyphomicrobiaceae bacterium]|nr:bifunctional 2-C-methyl-D-erythritol 4-phosphate cytidylyltransferase/2-C-methyl-D-erythritol 2,4-cyclodiphosphate synthase [Hyphomicrobiaceae bacterium]